MSRIEEAFRILRSIERGEPQPTASHIQAEREYWERRAAQAENRHHDNIEGDAQRVWSDIQNLLSNMKSENTEVEE